MQINKFCDDEKKNAEILFAVELNMSYEVRS